MLSPSKLFFGTPDPEPPPDEKPIWSGGDGLDMWQDSDDADEGTDVPAESHEQSAEQSLEASLNESEEERRSPLVPMTASAVAEHEQGLAIMDQQQRPKGPPPGLPLLGTDDLRPMTPVMMKPVLESQNDSIDKDSDDEEDADDERSHLSQEGLSNGKGLDAGGALRYSELPSIGSANHFSGNCDRCCFHPKGRCLNGFNCQHCHFDHEKRKRKNKKKNKSKQLSSLTCDENMEMLSVSADGSSMPVSPDAPFGPGMLPQADFPVSTSTTPLGSSAGFLQQQAPYYTGPDAGARPANGAMGPALAENKWFQDGLQATGAPSPSSPGGLPPPLQDGPNFAAAAPPGYDFPSQLPGGPCQTLLGPQAENGYPNRMEMDSRYAGEQDRREEYIRQLESENRYLRTCLMQYLGPNASALSLLPPPPGGPQQQQYFRPPEGLGNLVPPDVSDGSVGAPMQFGGCPPPPPGVPAPMPPGAPMVPGSGLPPSTNTTGGLSPSAPPFWPAWQDAGEMVDASRFDAPPHHPACLDQVAVPLRQDADGHVVSTSSVGQHLAGES